MKTSSSVIAPEQAELQKLIKNHTNYEKKVFKVANLQPKKEQTNKTASTREQAKFNYRGADEQDINGLVDRDETLENELRNIVL
jgi:hypothetical protein